MITGQITKILTQKENDWGRYEISSYKGRFLAVGVIPGAILGMTVTLEGWEEDNKYGHQYKIQAVLSSETDPCTGIRKFLSDGYISGIGSGKADEIIGMFGRDALDLFETEEGLRQLSMIRGLGKTTLNKAKKSYEENKKYKDIVLFLNGHGTKKQVEAIYEKYGNSAVKKLKANPYRIQTDIDGFGFVKADSIAMASGIKPDCRYRLMAASRYILDKAMINGDCYLSIDELREEVVELLVPIPKFKDVSDLVCHNALKDWNNNKTKLLAKYKVSDDTRQELHRIWETRKQIEEEFLEALSEADTNKELINDNGRIYTPKMYAVECETATIIQRMCAMDPVRRVDQSVIETVIEKVEEKMAGFKVTEEQKQAVYLALSNRLSIISGGPGRGKTTISKIVAQSFLNANVTQDINDIIMLAPTGRAAQRITESTGYPAMTAHRALLTAISDGIPRGKLILCDESSMADIFLMHSILKFARYCNLVLVGDVDQIASVGPGKVLRDMINSGVIPNILLKQGHRNTGTIASNSMLINEGAKLKDYTYDDHFVYVPATSASIADVIVDDYLKKVKEYGIKDVMLCTAMKDRGACAVNKLNERLQEIMTKGREEARFGDRRFRVGDRVMQIKNDYEFVLVNGGSRRKGIFNGERGTVSKIIYSHEEQEYRMVVLFDDGSIGGYTSKTASNLTLAYATTLHKCQGSEAACMMMAYTFGDFMLLNRSLFYTGETRAKKEFRFYGEEKCKYGKMMSAFDLAVSKTGDIKRNTALSERIKAA